MVASTKLQEVRALLTRFGLVPPAFLALGLTAGCGDKATDDDDDDGGDTDSATPLCSEATEHSMEGSTAEVYCDLLEFVDASDLSADDRQTLEECLDEMFSAMEREDLLSAFQSASEDDLAELLSELLQDCDGGGDAGDVH